MAEVVTVVQFICTCGGMHKRPRRVGRGKPVDERRFAIWTRHIWVTYAYEDAQWGVSWTCPRCKRELRRSSSWLRHRLESGESPIDISTMD